MCIFIRNDLPKIISFDHKYKVLLQIDVLYRTPTNKCSILNEK